MAKITDSRVFAHFFHRDGQLEALIFLMNMKFEVLASDSDSDNGIAQRNSDKDHGLSSDSDEETEISLDPPPESQDDSIKASVLLAFEKSEKMPETKISNAKAQNATGQLSLSREQIKTLPQ